MCHFITLVFPDAHEERVAAVLAEHGRVLRRVDNPAIAALLEPGEGQYLTARSCDCGTSLGTKRAFEEQAAGLEEQRKRLSRLGWSEAKTERWIRDRAAADTRRRGRMPNSIDYWDGLLVEIGHAGVCQAGLLLHSYSGALDETFDCSVGPVVSGVDRKEHLGLLEEDVLVRFATNP